MEYAVEEMKRQGHEVEVYYYDKPPLLFQYKNSFHRALSSLRKLVGGNERKAHRFNLLSEALDGKKFDKTIVIHGQYLNEKTLLFLKSISKEYIAFFFDSLTKMPRQRTIIKYFDKVYSYDPKDCEEEGFLFLTNFIPTEDYRSKEYKYTVFNISSLDHRIDALKKVAKYFNENGISYDFQLCNNKIKSLENFTINSKRIDVKNIFPMIKDAKVILEINRNDQTGLTFRSFEALGNEKKLITNNKEIKKYAFYKEENILIIDETDIVIPLHFLNSDYQPIPEEIYQKFTLSAWVKNILD